jgi:glycosyltransferase involved in cell wall biosynthesis
MSQPLVLLLAGHFALRGTSAYTLRLAEYLSSHDYRAKVVCPCARMVETDKRADLPILEYPHLLTPLWGHVIRYWLRKDVMADPPVLIHIQSRKLLPLGTWLARRLGAELLERTRVSADLVTVIPSGVEAVEELPAAVLDPNRIPVVGTAGPLEASKGLPYFLGAAQRVLAADVAAEFVIAGAGPEEENLRRLTRELGISEHVTFVPNVLDLTTSLSAMDVFCLPSLRQGLGTIMLEAMSLGRPVIATGVDGVYSVVKDNETGLVVPPSNSEQLAQRILELLRDPIRARQIGNNARQMVQRDFSVDRMMRDTVEVYQKVLSSK